MTPDPPAPDARQIAEPIAFKSIPAEPTGAYMQDRDDLVALIIEAISEATATAEAERDELRKLKAEIWDNQEKWMRWCDSRVLERAEAAEAKLTEARRQVWEEAAHAIALMACGVTCAHDRCDVLLDTADKLRQRAQPAAQPEEK